MHCYLIYTLLQKKSNHVGVKHLSQSRRLPLLQVVSNNKSFSVGVQSPTEINAPRGCAVILRRICQLSLTRITHQVSRAFDLNFQFRRSTHLDQRTACFFNIAFGNSNSTDIIIFWNFIHDIKHKLLNDGT